MMPPEHPPEPVSGAGASLLLESQKGRGHGGRGTGSSTWEKSSLTQVCQGNSCARLGVSCYLPLTQGGPSRHPATFCVRQPEAGPWFLSFLPSDNSREGEDAQDEQPCPLSTPACPKPGSAAPPVLAKAFSG